MIENVINSNILAVIIIFNYPNISYYFLHKYVCKTDWEKVFNNLEKYKGIIPYMRKNFMFKDLKNQYLVWASTEGHSEFVRILVEKGANVNIQDDIALRMAIAYEHSENIRILLEMGANVNIRADISLRHASENGHLEVVRILLDKGANVCALNDNALELASKNGHLKVVKLLIEKGADVYTENNYFIILASGNKHLKVVELLKKYSKLKINLNIKN